MNRTVDKGAGMNDVRNMTRRSVLAAGAALAATPVARLAAAAGGDGFPAGFLWGAATAGHQVEGNNVASDLWFLEHLDPTPFAEPSGDACNFFGLWASDLDLVKGLGLNAFRFSLE
jgi:beta-glucosidase